MTKRKTIQYGASRVVNNQGLKVVASTNIRDYICLRFFKKRSLFCVQPWVSFNFHQWNIFSYPLDEQLGCISKEENNAPILRHLRTALPVLRTQPDQAGSPEVSLCCPMAWLASLPNWQFNPQFWRHGGVKMNPSMRRWHVVVRFCWCFASFFSGNQGGC